MKHQIVSWLLVLAVLFVAGTASAVGRVQWESKTLKERSTKSWRVELKIFLPKAPDMAHMPMKFEFEPIAYYERSMVDGKDEVQERRVPLENRQPLIESVDVGFMDPGSGKIQKRTRFTFKVTRAHGFEAGEYKVTIRDSRSGKKIGTPTVLKFKGENEVIDRRSIVFTGKKKEKKADDAASGEGSSEGSEESPEDESAMEDDSSFASDEPFGDEELAEDDNAPPAIEEKPGGCGCRVQSGSSPGGALAAVALFGLFFVRRRRS